MSEFLTISPLEGALNKTLTVTVSKHTGTSQRVATYRAVGTTPYEDTVSSNRLTVIQAGAAEFVDLSNTVVEANTATATLTGKSNIAKLITLVTAQSPEVDIWQYLQSATITFGTTRFNPTASQLAYGYEVPGNPGAVAEYTITLDFAGIPNNATENGIIYSGTIASFTDNTILDVIAISKLSISGEEGQSGGGGEGGGDEGGGGDTPVDVPDIYFSSSLASDYVGGVINPNADIALQVNYQGNAFTDGASRTLSLNLKNNEFEYYLIPFEIWNEEEEQEET